MTKTIHVNRLKGRIDFAIITIREDEFEAVLRRLQPRTPVVGGRQFYEYCKLRKHDGRSATVAVVRAYDQGQTVAQSVSRDTIEDLFPRWLILTGIAGGIPDSEFTLGDVLLASSLHDLSITAAIEGDQPQFRPAGGPVHPAVERLIAYIPAWRDRLGAWNLEPALGMPKPRVNVPDDLDAPCYYGAEKFRTTVRDSLHKHFPTHRTVRPPLYKIAALATSNVLLKDTLLLGEWRKSARHITHIEMEAGGVYTAARHARPHELPLLSVRGISDIVGYKREPEWTQFACDSAASFLYSLITTLPTEFFVDRPSAPLSIPQASNFLLDLLHRVANAGRELATTVMTAFTDVDGSRSVTTPTLEDILKAFRQSSVPLLTRVVPANDRIRRPELDVLIESLETGKLRVTCVLGSPGSGKTALLALFAQSALEAGIVTLAIKADLLPADAPFETWGKREIGLEISTSDAIEVASTRGKVLVVVDQLDALSTTVDLKSHRLNTVLSFIDQCSKMPNVSVVCSCRNFDFFHDARFTALKPDILDLTLPKWEDVAGSLAQRGIADVSAMPPAFREVLRVPQHLNVYVSHFTAPGNANVAASYYLMLDDLWNRVTTAEERELLYSLTEYLMDKEVLWAPLLRFEKHKELIKALQAKQLLTVEDRRVGFQHQTLLEHAKARLFTKTGKSLTAHILDRQSAILVRPTVWVVMQYLRDADCNKYRHELEELFASDLRLHLLYLLIEFLGQMAGIEEYEIALLVERLRAPDYQARVLIAVRGSTEWFHALVKSHFPIVMAGAVENQWQMIGVISDAWDIDRDACLGLIERFWLPDATKDQLTWRTMNELGQWDEKSVDVVLTLIRRAAHLARIWWVESLVTLISEDKPQLAPRVFIEAAERQFPPLGAGEERSSHRRNSPLESHQEWYDLPAVANAAALEFLKAGWTWLVRICEEYHSGYPGSVLNRYAGWCFSLDNRDARPDAPVLTAFCAAIDGAAAEAPEQFVEITTESWASENAVVHRLIIRGLCIVAQTRPEIGLKYLSEDARRFELGSHESHEQSASISLIKAMVPRLGVEERTQLEQMIFAWSMYREEVDLDEDRDRWNQEARLRLLSAFPDELLSAETAHWVRSARLQLPEWNQQIASGGFGFVREIPPVSKEQMVTASTTEIVKLINASKESAPSHSRRSEVDGGWEEPGGPHSAGREIAELAKEHPYKAIEVIKALIADQSVVAAEVAIHELSEATLADEEVFEFVKEIAALRPRSEQLRSNASYVLYKRCKAGVGLPDDVCKVLTHWLSEPWDSAFGAGSQENAKNEQGQTNSVSAVLWGFGSTLLDTDRSFWTLMAMTHGYLMRRLAETRPWLDAVEQHLARDISDRTWAAYCSELRWIRIRGCDQNRGARIVQELFRRFPVLRTRREGIRVIAHLADLLSAEFLQEFLVSLDASREAQQGFGELLALIALRDKHHVWAGEWLQRLLSDGEEHRRSCELVFIGIAFAASHLWDEPEARGEAAGILCQLIPQLTNRIGQAIGTVFCARDDFIADAPTEMLLQTLAKNPGCFREIPIVDLVEHLAGLLPHKRTLVLNVCQAIVTSGRKENDLFEAGPHLVRIAMTLQRFDDTRTDGLTLFEDFLRLGLDDAYSTLRAIDIRPTTSKQREPRKRRRRGRP
jgi:nucleoside phosphorylase